MIRKLIFPILAVFAIGACHAHARVGPVHAGGGVADASGAHR
jgi:hypothetical protein